MGQDELPRGHSLTGGRRDPPPRRARWSSSRSAPASKLTARALRRSSWVMDGGSGRRRHERVVVVGLGRLARLLADVGPAPHLASSRESGRVRKRALRSRSAPRNTTGVLGRKGAHAMSKPMKKTNSRTKRTPVTLTRHEIERAGESIVAASEALARHSSKHHRHRHPRSGAGSSRRSEDVRRRR